MQQKRKTVAAPATTETRAASLSCHDAHKLDNGVAGMEDLSGSKDLSKSLSTSEVMVCHLLQTKHTQRHKDGRPRVCASRASSAYTATCKPCTQSALGLCAAVAFHQQQHIKGDRETALTRWVVLKCCGNELIEVVTFTEPVKRLSVG